MDTKQIVLVNNFSELLLVEVAETVTNNKNPPPRRWVILSVTHSYAVSKAA
jgi:hypothetical protein